MAVIDRKNNLGLEQLTDREKYDMLAKMMYIRGKPVLNGPLAVRMVDSAMIRVFGILFNLGKKEASDEEEYRRLTGNFKRIGNIARRLKFFGAANRFLVRIAMRSSVNMLGRQKICGLENEKNDVCAAAARYFTAANLFDFKIEVDEVKEDCVEFRFLECPAGYESGDDMKLCMATNKWDRQCLRMMGARMIIEELIPEGSPACVAHIVPEREKVPGKWRRYTRFAI